MTRKIIFAILGISLIVGAYFLSPMIANSKNKKKPKAEKVVKTVYVDTVFNNKVPIIIPANGSLLAKRRIDLYAEVQGVFLKGSKLFKPGETYLKGQNIIRIDASEYRATVQSAKSNLYNAVASILPDLRLDYPEFFDKWQAYLSGFDLNKSTPTLPDFSSEKEKLFISGRGIVTSYYNLKNLEHRLTKYTIRAPFSGILVQSLATEGALIRNGQKLGEFIDPSVYELEIAIAKQYGNLLKVGETVQLHNIERTKQFTGKLTRINGSIDATTQTLSVFVEVADPSLKEGMFLQANIKAKAEDNAIEINRSLLTENENIFIVQDSILDLQTVKPIYFSDKTVVIKGVPNGTVILKQPLPGAYAGMVVKTIKQQ